MHIVRVAGVTASVGAIDSSTNRMSRRTWAKRETAWQQSSRVSGNRRSSRLAELSGAGSAEDVGSGNRVVLQGRTCPRDGEASTEIEPTGAPDGIVSKSASQGTAREHSDMATGSPVIGRGRPSGKSEGTTADEALNRETGEAGGKSAELDAATHRTRRGRSGYREARQVPA